MAIGEEFAQQQGMYFLETSAKEADNVERLFYEIAAELIEQARTKEVTILLLGYYLLRRKGGSWFNFFFRCNRCRVVKLAEFRI